MSKVREKRICDKCKNRYIGDDGIIRQLVAARRCLANVEKILDKIAESIIKQRSKHGNF